MDEISGYPVSSQSPQDIVLRANKDGVTEGGVTRGLGDLITCLFCQIQLVFVLDIPTCSIQNFILRFISKINLDSFLCVIFQNKVIII